MAKTLQEFTKQAMDAYAPAKQALQDQLNSLSGQLQDAEASINRQFANQQKELDTQRQTASSVASMQAAGSGGSFGGKANIANRNYYRDAFVPAVARLQTNQANALGEARRQNQNQRLSLQSQLANLLTQANTSSLARYDDWNRFDQNMAWDKDKFGQTMAWDKDKFNQNMAWDKERFNRQLAESRAMRAQAAVESNRLFNYQREQQDITRKQNEYLNRASVPFEKWLYIPETLNSDSWAGDMTLSDKYKYNADLIKRYKANPNDSNIINGSSYQDYFKWKSLK